MNAACLSCHFTDLKVAAMKKVNDILRSYSFNRNSIDKVIKFNWGLPEKCRYGMTACNTLTQNKRDFDRLSSELDKKLSVFISRFATEDLNVEYREILSYFRGACSSVYIQLEQEVRAIRKEE